MDSCAWGDPGPGSSTALWPSGSEHQQGCALGLVSASASQEDRATPQESLSPRSNCSCLRHFPNSPVMQELKKVNWNLQVSPTILLGGPYRIPKQGLRTGMFSRASLIASHSLKDRWQPLKYLSRPIVQQGQERAQGEIPKVEAGRIPWSALHRYSTWPHGVDAT